MKKVFLTTLFAGCLAVSSVMAEGAAFNAGEFDFGAKISAGGIFSRIKHLDVKKNTGFGGIAFLTKYNVSDCFGIGLELLYDFYSIKKSESASITSPFDYTEGGMSIAEGANIDLYASSKTNGRFGAVVTLSYAPVENFSINLGIGIVKAGKLKYDFEISSEEKKVDVNIKQKSKVAPIFKIGADYHFNKNISLGIEGSFSNIKFKKYSTSDVKVEDKDFSIDNLKVRMNTIAATIKYVF